MSSDDKAVYTEGTVWSIQFLRTKPGTTAGYLKYLREAWKPIMEKARREKIILSYKVLLSNMTSPSDWDVMMIIELKNMAALDGYREKMDALIGEAAGGGSCNLFLDPGTEYMRLVREVNFL